MPDEERLEDLMERAAPLLREAFGREVLLCNPRKLRDGSRSLVVRCEVMPTDAGAGSVILKLRKPAPESERVFTDWASLQFLSQVPRTRGIAPRFYGGNVAQGLYAIEDLGGSISLEDLLGGHDTHALRATLNALGIGYARLHTHTGGREAEFATVCRSLPRTGVPGRHQEAARWLENRTAVLDWFGAVECPLPVGFDESLDRIARTYAEPGPFLCFTHGDPAPTNNHVVGAEVRLLDFEFGGFRHALYDLTAWTILCPLPMSLVQEMDRAYRATLAPVCEAVVDETLYREAWAHLCAYRALAMLSWIPRSILIENQSWVGEWTRREALLVAVSRLHETAGPIHSLAAVAEAAARLEDRLCARWPEHADRLPDWPVLQDLPS